MQTPNTPFLGADARARHQAYLQAAADWRLQQTVRAANPTQRRSGQVSIAQRVIRWGQRVLEAGKPAVPADEIW